VASCASFSSSCFCRRLATSALPRARISCAFAAGSTGPPAAPSAGGVKGSCTLTARPPACVEHSP
jgi:hypothetical protein